MKIKYIVIIVTLFFSACAKDQLEVEYKNNPDKYALLENPDDIYGMSSGLFYNWYKAQYYAYTFSPIMAMATMSDQLTCSFTNGGMYELSSEPRIAFINSEEYSWKKITQSYYERMYSSLTSANDILDVINVGGMEIGEIVDGKGEDTELVKAFAYFNQGITLGYLGLVFDKAFIVTDEIPADLDPRPYGEVVTEAVVSLEKCITVCENNTFTVPLTWINGSEYSNTELAQLAHSFIARILSYSARNVADNNATDWQKVLDHAEAGIQRDLAPYMDNITWKNYWFNYSFNSLQWEWTGVDARIIHLMDNNSPEKFPDLSIEPAPAVAVSADARLLSDFVYDPTCKFKVERGYYHFFNYRHTRYDYDYNHPMTVIDFSLAENDLFIAEAKYQLGDAAGAKSLLNAGTRTTRGNLSPITDDNKIMEALFYERDIELMMTGFGIAYFDMRRRDMLQKGTILHFPLPAKELNVMGMEVYTFGGEENADGINTSNGGWFSK